MKALLFSYRCRKAPCEVESDPEARLAYLKTLCSDPRWILGLGILAKIHKEDVRM